MYEHRLAPLLPWRPFKRRLAWHALYAGSLVGVSLIAGTAGFHLLARMSWIDGLLNAAMLLGGMGPVGDIQTLPGKLFASAFALYAGLVFLVAGAVLLTPALHRMLHRFHLEQADAPHRSSDSRQRH